MYGIGIDTGGTCTDAVIYDTKEKKVLASAKSQTTHGKLELGISNSLAKLPRELVQKVEFISLSTTLATNACVERKGGRVALIFIGVKKKTVYESYANYGFEGTDFMYFLDADVTKNIDPDWDELRALLPEIVSKYDSVAISQLMPKENNGAYEKKAMEIILEEKKMPIVCAYEIFKDLNAIKRGAGALLNARLLPVMEEFFQAIHMVLEKEKMDIPFYIMRSDGGIVSEEYAMQYPVETLLCGPTASVKGAIELMPCENAIVVDMGGTTSDVALIRDGEAIINEDGVKVGDWQTFVKGVEIDTFALGGDTRVCYHNAELCLDNRRVIPISSLGAEYPGIIEELKHLASRPMGSSKAAYEHLIIINSIEGKEDFYNEQEKKVYHALESGPLSMSQIADAVGSDIFTLNTERLETERIVMRCGFTPTDAMVIKGDREDSSVNRECAEMAATFIANSTKIELSDIPEMTYDLVKKRLYCNLVRKLYEDQMYKLSKPERERLHDTIMDFAALEFDNRNVTGRFFQNHFQTDCTLVGIGAPVHVFVDDVAKMLGTTARVSEYSGVSNAIGAMLGDVCTSETVEIVVDYSYLANFPDAVMMEERPEEFSEIYIVYGEKKYGFYSEESAVEYAKAQGAEIARKKAVRCGAKEIVDTYFKEKTNSSRMNYGGELVLGLSVTAWARGTLLG